MLLYGIPYKTLIGAKPLRIIFSKIDKFIRNYYLIKYLVLFGLKKYDAIYDIVRYLIGLKSSIT